MIYWSYLLIVVNAVLFRRLMVSALISADLICDTSVLGLGIGVKQEPRTGLNIVVDIENSLTFWFLDKNM